MALAILGMPVGKIAPETVAEILRGGASICAEAGSLSPAATPSTRPSRSTGSR